MSFLTSLVSALKGGGGSRVPLARSFDSPWSFAFERGGTRLPFEYRSAVRHAFLDNPVAQRAVRLVAEGVGSAPLLPADEALLGLVGATSAGQPLLETLAAHLLLHGNGFVQIVKDGAGRPVELFALRPERVSVVPGPDGWPAAFSYKVGDRTLTIPVEDEEDRARLSYRHPIRLHGPDERRRTPHRTRIWLPRAVCRGWPRGCDPADRTRFAGGFVKDRYA